MTCAKLRDQFFASARKNSALETVWKALRAGLCCGVAERVV
jgi:hypothetical protein